MAKKKKPTLIEKHFKDILLRYLLPLQYDPHFWDKLFVDAKTDNGLGKILKSERDYWSREALKYIHLDDPIEALKQAHADVYDEYWFYQSITSALGLYFVDYHSVTIHPRQALERDKGRYDTVSGLQLIVHLHRKDGEIIGGLNRELEYFCQPRHKKTPEGKSLYAPGDWVLEVDGSLPCTTPEHTGPVKCRAEELDIGVNLSAGKVKIRKAVEGLLAEYQPRWILRPERLQLDTWELRLKVFRLHNKGIIPLEDIAPMIGKSYERTHSLYKEAYEWIKQEPLGTAKTRGKTSVRIQDRVGIPLEEAEKIFARNQLTGEGSKHVSGQEWDDGAEESIIVPEETWPAALGEYRMCDEECSQMPGSETCSDCTPWRNSILTLAGMGDERTSEVTLYVSRKYLPPTYAGSGRIVGSLIQPDMVAEEKESKRGRRSNVGKEKYLAYWDWRHHKILEEIAFIRGYSYNHNYTNPWNPIIYSQLPRKQIGPCKGLGVAKNSKSLWRIPIAHIRQHEKVSRIRFDLSAECISDFSRKFTMRKDLLETYFVEGIDQGLLCSDKMEVPNRSPCLDCEWVNEDKDDCLASGCNKIRKFQQVLPELAEAA